MSAKEIINYNDLLLEACETLGISKKVYSKTLESHGFNIEDFDANRTPGKNLIGLFTELHCEMFLCMPGHPYSKEFHQEMILRKKMGDLK